MLRRSESQVEILLRLERNNDAIKTVQPVSGDSLRLYAYSGTINSSSSRKFLVFRSNNPDLPSIVKLTRTDATLPIGSIPIGGVYFWRFDNLNLNFVINSTQPGTVTIENSPPFTI